MDETALQEPAESGIGPLTEGDQEALGATAFPKPANGDVLAYGFGSAYSYDVTKRHWCLTSDCHINYALGKGYVQAPIPAPGPDVPNHGDVLAWDPGSDIAFNLTQHKWFPAKYVCAQYGPNGCVQA